MKHGIAEEDVKIINCKFRKSLLAAAIDDFSFALAKICVYLGQAARFKISCHNMKRCGREL